MQKVTKTIAVVKNRVVPSSASQDGLQVPNEKEKLELHEEESNEPLVVNVLIRHARGLATKGRSSFVDPFCVVSYASSKFKTSVVHGNRDPVWNEEFSLSFQKQVLRSDKLIKIGCWDRDRLKSDTYLGSFAVPMQKVLDDGKLSGEFALKAEGKHKGSHVTGYLSILITLASSTDMLQSLKKQSSVDGTFVGTHRSSLESTRETHHIKPIRDSRSASKS